MHQQLNCLNCVLAIALVVTVVDSVEAGKLDKAQSEWHQHYSKQANAPKPEEMLLNKDAEPDLSEGFEPLFNGKNLTGWSPLGGTCKFSVKDDCIVGQCVPGSASTYLCTDAADFTNFAFTCDMKWEIDGNTGVMFRAQVKKTDKNAETVFGPQAEMEGFSKDRGWSGGIYGQSCGGFFYPVWLEEHQEARSALKKGVWNRLTISAHGKVVKTWVNGVPVAHWVGDGTYSKGLFGLQIHKGNAGTVLWKNLRIKELTSRPKIAVMETAFQKRADVTSFNDARAAGYTAIQMHSGVPDGFNKKPLDQSLGLEIGADPSVLKSWETASQEHGVEIISLCAGSLNKCQIWDRDRELAMRIAKQTIDGCHELDVHVMLFPFFGPSNFQTSDEALEGVANFLKELLPYAQKNEVVIGIEAPVTTVRVLELLEKLDYPEHLKIYYDTGNLFAKEDIYETIRKHGKQHFCEVHIKAAGSAIIGQGQIDLAKLAKALDAAEYDKWLVYEANRDGKNPVANRKGIENIVSLRECYSRR
jgi:sugar phosphate isomerase/epimerase